MPAVGLAFFGETATRWHLGPRTQRMPRAQQGGWHSLNAQGPPGPRSPGGQCQKSHPERRPAEPRPERTRGHADRADALSPLHRFHRWAQIGTKPHSGLPTHLASPICGICAICGPPLLLPSPNTDNRTPATPYFPPSSSDPLASRLPNPLRPTTCPPKPLDRRSLSGGGSSWSSSSSLVLVLEPHSRPRSERGPQPARARVKGGGGTPSSARRWFLPPSPLLPKNLCDGAAAFEPPARPAAVPAAASAHPGTFPPVDRLERRPPNLTRSNPPSNLYGDLLTHWW
jgi:hypothetical protein